MQIAREMYTIAVELAVGVFGNVAFFFRQLAVGRAGNDKRPSRILLANDVSHRVHVELDIISLVYLEIASGAVPD